MTSWGTCGNRESLGREPTAPCSCTSDCEFDVVEDVYVHQSAAAAAAAADDDDQRWLTASLVTPNPIHISYLPFYLSIYNITLFSF